MTTYIYGLLDPRTDELRYVGKSNNPQARLQTHLNTATNLNQTSPVNIWIRTLLNLALMPELVLLEDAGDDWQESEYRWIETLKAEGYPLLNVRPGGMRSGNQHQNRLPLPSPRWWRPTVAPLGEYVDSSGPHS